MNGGDEWQIGVISVSVYLSTYFIKANLSKKPAKKIFSSSTMVGKLILNFS